MPQPPAAATGHTWAVTGQEEELSHDDNGKPTTVHHVTFKTNTGHTSTVSLPDSHFTAANVAAQIHHKAGEINRVHNLTSANAPAPE